MKYSFVYKFSEILTKLILGSLYETEHLGHHNRGDNEFNKEIEFSGVQDKNYKFIVISITCLILYCIIPYIILVFIFFLNNSVFPTGILDAYKSGSFLVLIAFLGGFLGYFSRSAKFILNLDPVTEEKGSFIWSALPLGYLLSGVLGIVSLAALQSKALINILYDTPLEKMPQPTEFGVFLTSFLVGMFAIELVGRTETEVVKKIKIDPIASEVENSTGKDGLSNDH